MPVVQYEAFTSADDIAVIVDGAVWKSQTFTPSTTHAITYVILKLYRLGSPGTLTVSITAVDGGGLPTGADLCVGTMDGNSLTTSVAGATYQIDFTTTPTLDASTQYAIVIRATSGDALNAVYVRSVNLGGYSGGIGYSSVDSGATWASLTSDAYFEEWGIAADPAAFFSFLNK